MFCAPNPVRQQRTDNDTFAQSRWVSRLGCETLRHGIWITEPEFWYPEPQSPPKKNEFKVSWASSFRCNFHATGVGPQGLSTKTHEPQRQKSEKKNVTVGLRVFETGLRGFQIRLHSSTVGFECFNGYCRSLTDGVGVTRRAIRVRNFETRLQDFGAKPSRSGFCFRSLVF